MIPADVVMNNSIKININMRCIEMQMKYKENTKQ